MRCHSAASASRGWLPAFYASWFRPVIERLAVLLAVVIAAVGCVHRAVEPGPPSPIAERIVEVRVTSLPPANPLSKTISDQGKVRSIAKSGALSQEGWWETRGRRLLPLYRIDFVDQDGGRLTYWLGTNSYPASFPCYAICSGWWIAPSSEGALDDTRYRGLTSATYFNFLHDLQIP